MRSSASKPPSPALGVRWLMVGLAGCALGVAAAAGIAAWVTSGQPAVDAEVRPGAAAVASPPEIAAPSQEASEKPDAPGVPEPGGGLDPGARPAAPEDRAGASGSEGNTAGGGNTAGWGTAEERDLRSAQGRTYTYHDGDRVLEVAVQSDLVVPSGVTIASSRDIVRRSDSPGGGDPVFREESGGMLMALPGGVLLVLDPQWSGREVAEFFARNGVSKSAVSELAYAVNGFFIETAPGLESLSLANDLAVQPGVELSSPNWWREAGSK